MLEQHQSDIATAQAEVDRLEALKHRESLLEKMHTAAESAKAHREAMNQALERAARGLQKSCQTMLKEWQAENEARKTFASIGTELVPGFNSLSEPAHAGMTNEQRQRFEADRATLLDELLERGVPLDYAIDGTTGRHSILDKYPKPAFPVPSSVC